MAHYVFICEECKKEFEKVLHIDELDKTEVRCPNCNNAKVTLQVASFSAVTSRKS